MSGGRESGSRDIHGVVEDLELVGRFGEGHIGTKKKKGLPNGTEVGDKKFYPSLRAQLRHVLDVIVPLLEDSSHFSQLPAIRAPLRALTTPPQC